MILVIAGEVSGDLYAALLVRHLKTLDPNLEIWAAGGPQLEIEATHFITNTVRYAAVGIAGIFKQWMGHPLLKIVKQITESTPIEKVIIVDFPHLNFKLGQWFQKANIPVETVITPHFWIWKDVKQAQRVAKYSSRIFTIFEKEYELYRPLHPSTYYFGHPMVELASPLPKTIPPTPLLTLFPGSRSQELDLVLHPMLKTARQVFLFMPNLRIRIALSSEQFKQPIQQACRQYPELNLEIWTGDKATLFQETSLLLCASGSATLEAVLHRVPMIIFCALPPLTYWIALLILRLKLRWVALPNIIAGREVIPEFVQHQIQPKRISQLVLRMLTTPQAKLTANYAKLEQLMRPKEFPFLEVAKTILSPLP